jgi:hypothetical protein
MSRYARVLRGAVMARAVMHALGAARFRARPGAVQMCARV